MGFFDNFKEKATDLAQAGVAQSKRLAEIAKLKTANMTVVHRMWWATTRCCCPTGTRCPHGPGCVCWRAISVYQPWESCKSWGRSWDGIRPYRPK